MNGPDPAATLRAAAGDARKLLDQIDTLAGPMAKATRLIQDALLSGKKLLCCGNGGSAADSAHFAEEIAGRYLLERPGFPAIDLTGSPALLTALINDYPPEEVFGRQIQALAGPGDVLAVFTTSGQSKNIIHALRAAKAKKLATVAFLGRTGGLCKGLADVEMIVPSAITARIQEVHQLLYHAICEALDSVLKEKTS